MAAALAYAIKYVADMDQAVEFHRDQLGLALRFASPFWTEFETGPTTLALHPATQQNPPGTCRLGFRVPDIESFYAELQDRGVMFSAPPTSMHGQKIARFLDPDGTECSVSGG